MGAMRRILVTVALSVGAWFALFGHASAARVSDIKNTPHNLSTSGPGTLKATTESQICVFCHTPHAAESIPLAPLWNRKLSAATYTTYTSSSIEASAAELAAGPGGASKLCLSCHDGTMAIGNVNVLNGKANVSITMTGTGAGGTMAAGSGATTGFTRNLGVNLTNDHPISFTYDASLASADGELRTPGGAGVPVANQVRGGTKPKLPLQVNQVQCTSCHDPHLRETDTTLGSGKFLRLNRFQVGTPTGGAFAENNDQICLGCHDKAGTAWAFSAHAHPTVADELYNNTAATLRGFPTGLSVAKAGCLNCHDTHTVQGARRLLREGTDSVASPKAGGNPALEQVCYQCHATLAESALANVTQVPNIKSDFALTYRMPITSTDQGQIEVHDIGTGTGAQRGKDFVESTTLLGQGALANRHVECTDCHNPHRVVKNRLFNANSATPDAGGAHNHAAGHTNIASGVLRGTTGVEPVYSGIPFGSVPSSFDFKRGDGGIGASTAVGSAWVTREYQVCLKCHSNYAYATPPSLGNSGGGTPSGTNGMTQYTDQAMEFQAPATHKGAASVTNSGAFAGTISPVQSGSTYSVNFQTSNHRAWHPVMGNTGRTHALRGISGTSPWLSPWNAGADVGAQTMYCSDCHGSNTAAGTVVPSGSNPWGPHGSTNPFILKGTWGSASGSPDANTVCFKCHTTAVYDTNDTGTGNRTGFRGGFRGNLHAYHREKIGRLRCTWCHVAVPHGWKNRSFLVNLNDVGPEVLCRQQDRDDLPTNMKPRCVVGSPIQSGTQMRNGPTNSTSSGATSTTNWANTGYTNPPYYLNALLKIRTFASPGSWGEAACGSAGTSGNPGNGQSGRDWMRDSNENCASAP